MNKYPDVEVEFEFNGTRRNPARNGYRPQHRVNESYLTSGIHHYYRADEVPVDGRATATVTFITPEFYPACLWVGKTIRIQEGERVVGHATVTKIFNPVLER